MNNIYDISEKTIEKFKGKTVVIKYGGNAMIEDHLKECVLNDISFLYKNGIKVVLVHGGGPEISAMLKKVGIESRFVNGLRYTDKETVEIVQMVLCGKVNKNLTLKLSSYGCKAIGLSGLDSCLITAEKHKSEQDIGYVGDAVKINSDFLLDLVNCGYLPVISTVGADNQQNVYNINADNVASAVASALKADYFMLMTDISGVLRDVKDPESLIEHISYNEIDELMENGIISGGMIPKIKCCSEALEAGVNNTSIFDGRVEHSIISKLILGKQLGTSFSK